MSVANRKRDQRGYSIWTILVVLAIAAFIGTIAVSVAPPYINNSTVNSVIKNLASDPEITGLSNRDIRQFLERRFDVNQITAIQAVCRVAEKPCVRIERTAESLILDGSYEVRVPVMGNVDAVVIFDDNIVEIPLKK